MSPFQFWFQPVEDVCCSIIFEHIKKKKKKQMLALFQKHILKYGAQICVLNGYQKPSSLYTGS